MILGKKRVSLAGRVMSLASFIAGLTSLSFFYIVYVSKNLSVSDV